MNQNTCITSLGVFSTIVLNSLKYELIPLLWFKPKDSLGILLKRNIKWNYCNILFSLRFALVGSWMREMTIFCFFPMCVHSY